MCGNAAQSHSNAAPPPPIHADARIHVFAFAAPLPAVRAAGGAVCAAGGRWRQRFRRCGRRTPGRAQGGRARAGARKMCAGGCGPSASSQPSTVRWGGLRGQASTCSGSLSRPHASTMGASHFRWGRPRRRRRQGSRSSRKPRIKPRCQSFKNARTCICARPRPAVEPRQSDPRMLVWPQLGWGRVRESLNTLSPPPPPGGHFHTSA